MLWKDIEDLVPERLSCECHQQACEYYENFYCGDLGVKFSMVKAKSIVQEIKKDAEFYLRLKGQEERQKELRRVWPNVDKYIASVCKKEDQLELLKKYNYFVFDLK